MLMRFRLAAQATRSLSSKGYVFAFALALAAPQVACVAPGGTGDSPQRRGSLFGSLLSPDKNADDEESVPGFRPRPQSNMAQVRGQGGLTQGNTPQQGAAHPPTLGGRFENPRGGGADPHASHNGQRRPGVLGHNGIGFPPPSAAARGLEMTRVEGNIWRTGLGPAQAFNMLARILSQDYILAASDRKNLNLQTDWDKFFLEGRLFRNRLSITLFPLGPRQTEVVVKNTVEYFAGNPNKPEESSSSAWMPSPDLTDEVARIVDSINRQTAFLNNSRAR